MFITTFQRKPVRGKMQWVCERSDYIAAVNAEWWKKCLAKNKPFIAYNMLMRFLAVTPNRVNLGSCKRPHHYIWSKS
jgi:hypothetical protein